MDITTTMTLDERERRAFVEGDAALAATLGHAAEQDEAADDAERRASELEDAFDAATRRIDAHEAVLQAVVGALREARLLRVPQAAALADALDELCNGTDDIDVTDAEARIERACGLRE